MLNSRCTCPLVTHWYIVWALMHSCSLSETEDGCLASLVNDLSDSLFV